MLADVQTRNEVAVIDPTALTITRRVPLPGCDHPHGPPWTRNTGWRSWPATPTPPC